MTNKDHLQFYRLNPSSLNEDLLLSPRDEDYPAGRSSDISLAKALARVLKRERGSSLAAPSMRLFAKAFAEKIEEQRSGGDTAPGADALARRQSELAALQRSGKINDRCFVVCTTIVEIGSDPFACAVTKKLSNAVNERLEKLPAIGRVDRRTISNHVKSYRSALKAASA